MNLSFLDELNKEQRLAATTFDGPLLILAGAGSGKTKTIVSRTANMIANGTDPSSILVLTFTNKAAKEMKERGETLLKQINYKGKIPLFTTFHSFGLTLLKSYLPKAENMDINENFSIADENVQKRIAKDLIKEIFAHDPSFKETNFTAMATILQNNLVSYDTVEQTYKDIESLIQSFQRTNKSLKWLRENKIETKRDIRKLAEMYVKYKENLRKNNLADFDDLINLPVKLLESNEKIRSFIKTHFKYIMIDEFQDTNYSQIRLLNLILNNDDNICVVGDDSQSIYGWRGADIEYILNFHKNYDNVLKINLTKNYRSTKEIVSHANTLIEQAEQKHEFKEALEAFKKEQGKILCKGLENEYVEAQAITFYIKQLLLKGAKPNEIAILYRNNFIASSLEKELIKSRVPYRIYKGRTLLQKKAVQEYLSFINFFVNPKNSVALELALTSSAKILTENKMDEIKRYIYQKDIDLTEFIFSEEWSEINLSKSQKNKLASFVINTIEIQKQIKEGLINEEFLNLFYEKFPLIKEYENTLLESNSAKTREQADKALKDISLINSIIMDFKTIREFIDSISLAETTDKDDDEDEESNKHKINLMTIHASKGLEFDFVFVARMNQGIIPSTKSLEEASLVEEERRLAYVAITRAKKFLHVSYVKTSRTGNMLPSMFIREANIPISKEANMHGR